MHLPYPIWFKFHPELNSDCLKTLSVLFQSENLAGQPCWMWKFPKLKSRPFLIGWLVGWLVVLMYDALAIFQPYRELEAGDNINLWISEIIAARPGIERRTSCSASQELIHYTIATPDIDIGKAISRCPKSIWLIKCILHMYNNYYTLIPYVCKVFWKSMNK